MSYAIPCTNCGEMFMKFSNKSYESRCKNCRGNRDARNVHRQRKVRKMKAEKTIQERMNELQDAIDVLKTEMELINADIEAGMNERNTIAGDIEAKAMESLKTVVEEALEDMMEDKTLTKNIAMLNTRILQQRDKQEKESERIRRHLNELCDVVGFKKVRNYDSKTGEQLPEPDATVEPESENEGIVQRRGWFTNIWHSRNDKGEKEIIVGNPIEHPLTLKEAKEQPKEEPTTKVIVHTTEEDAVLEAAEEIEAKYGGIGKHWTRAGSEHKVPMEGRKCTRCGTTKTPQWRYVGLQHSFAPLCNKCGNNQRRSEGKDAKSIKKSNLKQNAKRKAKRKGKGRKRHCCSRCGRPDHNIRKCYARTHIKTKERLDPATAQGLSPSQKKRKERKAAFKVDSEREETARIATKREQDEARIMMAYTYMKEDGMLLSRKDLKEFWMLVSYSEVKRLVNQGITQGRFVIMGKRGTKGRPMTLYGAAERNERGDSTE